MKTQVSKEPSKDLVGSAPEDRLKVHSCKESL